tara:strand:- start:149 stop:835 length:687 start_codon:yes stop_codon:yes gene_type:complete
MKKQVVKLFFIISLISFGNISSQNLDEILRNPHYPIDFLGLDFSELKFIGNSGVSGYTLRNQFFGEWNYMFFSEKKKYNVGKYIKIYKKRFPTDDRSKNWLYRASMSVNYRTDYIEEINMQVDPKNIVLLKNYDLKDFSMQKIQEVINRYSFEFASPVGLTFIVNYFNWLSGESNIVAVFFNSETKEILFSKSFTGKGSGRNFRNFWMNSIDQILPKLEKAIRNEVIK